MSFSGECKEELVKIRLRDAALRKAQLSGVTLTAGGIRLSRPPAVFYNTESLVVARHIVALASSLFELDCVIECKTREHRRTPLYDVSLSGNNVEQMLSDTGAMVFGETGLQLCGAAPASVLQSDECKKAFLRGCFLGSGVCVNPQRSYHLEIMCCTDDLAEQIVELLNAVRLHGRKTTRKGRTLVYLKEGDDVSGFLALIGANVAAMQFENVRVEKDMRNYVNRTSNCETANLDKCVVASLKQCAAIRTIERHMALSKLPASLEEAALLRMNHPDATLQELADMADIQKSGMNHRLARLLKLAKELEG